MKKPSYRSIFEKLASKIGTAIDRAHSSLHDGRVEQEPAMTDRMLGRIEQAVDGLEINGVRWSAKTLTDRGNNAQEAIDGADFMGVLHVDLPDYKISKGFLAQAKRIKRNEINEFRTLPDQCRRMLRLSPASYVFLYSENGVDVVSASGVVAANSNLRHLQKKSAAQFFNAHLQCFVGDESIHAATPRQLEELRIRKGVDSAILISTAEW